VSELAEKPFQWAIFIQAMIKIMKSDHSPVAAKWQEMAGIHGAPYVRWPGDPQGPPNPTGKDWQGYCYHAAALFPTWHRVVMLLIEQSVSEAGHTYVNELLAANPNMPDAEKKQWQDAAKELRFPYWDWSTLKVENEGIPKEFTQDDVPILGPGGKLIVVPENPIKTFKFDPIPKDFFDDPDDGVYFAQWNRTLRWATQKVDPQDDYVRLNHALQQNTNPPGSPFNTTPVTILRSKLATLFKFPAEATSTMYGTYWDYFSNTRPMAPSPPEVAIIGSLEDPHNKVHLDLGGTGHMAWNEVAAFDPIFYFHHCNIDRFYALWEYCYPDFWVGEGFYDSNNTLQPFRDYYGTYNENEKAPITSKSNLTPFRKTVSDYYHSDDIRGLSKKSYTYPPLTLPLITMDPATGETLTKEVTIDVTKPSTLAQRREYISALHQHYWVGFASNTRGPPPLGKAPIFRSIPADDAPTRGAGAVVPIDGVREFVVVGHVYQYAFKGSHRLELYFDDNLVSDISVLSRLNPAACENCAARVQDNATVRGIMTIPHNMVIALLDKLDKNDPNTSDEDVINTLSSHIRAKIVSPSGRVLADGIHGQGINPPTHRGGGGPPPVLETGKAPILQFYSARVMPVVPEKGETGGNKDWIHHGAVLTGDWRISA